MRVSISAIEGARAHESSGRQGTRGGDEEVVDHSPLPHASTSSHTNRARSAIHPFFFTVFFLFFFEGAIHTRLVHGACVPSGVARPAVAHFVLSPRLDVNDAHLK